MVKAVRYVHDAWINRGSGILDFPDDLKERRPDMFIVNEDGHSPARKDLCAKPGIEYIVLKRTPEAGLPARSTTSIRSGIECQLPYRIDLAGTWIDQPSLSKIHPGWALTISIEPVIEYNERSGMATSTRNAAREIWPYHLPPEKPEKLAEILFRYENKPGSSIISGAQDAIGICIPGLVRHYYPGEFWPSKIEKTYDEQILGWIEKHLRIITLWPRPDGTDLLVDTDITKENITALASAAEECWEGIMAMDLEKFADGFRK